MIRTKFDFRGQSFRSVLGYTWQHWQRQPWRIAVIAASALGSAMADVFTPLYAGRLIDELTSGNAKEIVWPAALHAFWLLIGLGLAGILLRQAAYMNIISLTLKMMYDIAASSFYKVQRFSTDWHANSFAGSTVRKITRGIWALDLLDDTLLVALLPSLAMLVGATVLLALHWPVMGLVVGLGALIYIVATGLLALGYVAPSARLANSWDTRLGGALADAV
ncbi:MAG TPA: ABC transporter ATP-binding protein, partial [Bordetella sp.]